MSKRGRNARLVLSLGGIGITLLLAVIFTLGSLNVPFEPRDLRELVVLFALNTFIVAALLVFGLVLGRTFLRLWTERRANQLGSRFKTKMVMGATAVSLLPLVFLFFISYALMNRTLNRWFPRSLEIANSESQMLLGEINHAEDLRLLALAQRSAAEALREPASAALGAQQKDRIEAAARFAVSQGAEGVWALDSSGAVLSIPSPLGSPLTLDPSLKVTRLFNSGGELWTARSGNFFAVRIPFQSGFLVVARRLPADFADRLSVIEGQTEAYGIQQQQIRTFKRQILLTLSLFTVLLLFATTWFALYLAKQVTVPIEALAEATQEVASGRFDVQVRVPAQDELRSLVRAFNKMTGQLADSRRQIDEFTSSLQHAVQELERRRTLIETVLESVPTGVLSLDSEGRIVKMNRAAQVIFGSQSGLNVPLAALASNSTSREMQHLIRRALRMGAATQELEFRVQGRVLHCAVTVSPLGPRRSGSGYVVVVDDLTELLRAQKAAAWQEVAQRIAHEIKNPLTPIQLSAERLLRYVHRHRAEGEGQELARLVTECATLIGREVGTMEALVNEFSQFVRFPVARLSAADPNAIVRSALEVFHGRLDDVEVLTRFDSELPMIRADAEMLRSVIVNLIDNAAESMEGAALKRIELVTRFHPEHETVEIAVADTGHGISPEDKDKLFLPHFSTKDRGTGLGLAIASRVISEHHGLIRAEDNIPSGARFVIELPAAEMAPITVPSGA